MVLPIGCRYNCTVSIFAPCLYVEAGLTCRNCENWIWIITVKLEEDEARARVVGSRYAMAEDEKK